MISIFNHLFFLRKVFMLKNYKLMLVLFLVSYSLSNAMEPKNCDNRMLQKKEIVTVVFPCINNDVEVVFSCINNDEDQIDETRLEEQVIQIVGLSPFRKRRIVKALGYYNLTIGHPSVSITSARRTMSDRNIRNFIFTQIIVPLSKLKDTSGREMCAGLFKTLDVANLANIRELQRTKKDKETKQKVFDDEKSSLFKK